MSFILSLHEMIAQMLKEKMPSGTNLTEFLTGLLSLSKAAVYRRLDGKVSFTFNEMAIIAQAMNLSLDEMIGNIPEQCHLLKLKIASSWNPSETDYRLMEQSVKAMRWLKQHPDSRVEGAINLIPDSLYTPYENISRYYLFKWIYQYGYAQKIIAYKDVEMEPKARLLQLEYAKALREASSTSLIFDYLTFYYLVNDLKYFLSFELITREEIDLIQKDLLLILDDLEWSCIHGKFKDSEQKLFIYISNINFDTNYCYVDTNKLHLTLVRACLLHNLVSRVEETFDQVKDWIQSLKRSSTLISETGERSRILFFNKQRALIKSLNDPDTNIEEFLLGF